MQKYIFKILLGVLVISCATNTKQDVFPKIVPDNTPYIAGLVEFSHDTTHHYPEILVGYFTDLQDANNANHLSSYPGIYNPTLSRQVVQTSILFNLGFVPETEAVVTVVGPLNMAKKQKVIFTHLENGIYGDNNYQLPRIPGGKYKLLVELPDGQSYQANTVIPVAVELSLQDSIALDVEYKPYGDGTPKEEDKAPFPIVYTHPPNSYMTVLQYNSDKDRSLLLLDPDEEFGYSDRSNYLRTGIGYSVGFSYPRRDTLVRSWVQSLNKPIEEVWMYKHWWLRFSFYSKGIGKMFFPLVDIFVTEDQWLDQISTPSADAAVQHDSTYLFDVSTIHKVGADGQLLPKEESDAIGFFGGYFSVYRQTTVYPIRNFDLDSVLTQ